MLCTGTHCAELRFSSLAAWFGQMRSRFHPDVFRRGTVRAIRSDPRTADVLAAATTIAAREIPAAVAGVAAVGRIAVEVAPVALAAVDPAPAIRHEKPTNAPQEPANATQGIVSVGICAVARITARITTGIAAPLAAPGGTGIAATAGRSTAVIASASTVAQAARAGKCRTADRAATRA